jgi:hypothetical protein
MTTRPTTRLSAPAFERLARKIMAENGLSPEWTFEWGHATSRIGVCVWKKKVLRFSKPAFTGATYEQGFDTITHEVAHAIAGPRHGHDVVWQRVHARLGGSAERTWKDAAELGPSLAKKRANRKVTWVVCRCSVCGYEDEVQRRVRAACPLCCRAAGGGYREEFKLDWFRYAGKPGVSELVPYPLPPR